MKRRNQQQKRFKPLWIAGVALLAACLTQAAEPDPLPEGLKAIQKGQYEEAVVCFQAALRQDPKNKKAVEELLKSYAALGRYQDAATLLRESAEKGLFGQSLAQNDLDAIAALVKAKSMLEADRKQEAVSVLETTVAKKCYYVPASLQAARMLGNLYYAQGEFSKAVPHLEAVLGAESRPGPSPETLERYLFALLRSGHAARALERSDELAKFLDKEKREATLGNLRAACYHQMAASVLKDKQPAIGQLKAASEFLRKASDAAPSDEAVTAEVRALKFKVHVPLADALWKEAQAARQAGDTATENIKLWELTHFAPRGIPAVVRDARNRLYQISQEAHQAYMQAFTNHLVPGHYEAASAAFKTIAAKYPLTEAAEKCLFNAGGALEKADAPDEALRRYAALLKQYPQSSLFPITCFKLACYYQDQKKDYAKAEEYFRLAVDRMPEGPHADLCQYMLGTLFYQTGNFKRCYEEQKKFLKNYPESDLRARGLLQVQVIEKNGWKEVTKGEPQVPGKPAAAKAQEGGKR